MHYKQWRAFHKDGYISTRTEICCLYICSRQYNELDNEAKRQYRMHITRFSPNKLRPRHYPELDHATPQIWDNICVNSPGVTICSCVNSPGVLAQPLLSRETAQRFYSPPRTCSSYVSTDHLSIPLGTADTSLWHLVSYCVNLITKLSSSVSLRLSHINRPW